MRVLDIGLASLKRQEYMASHIAVFCRKNTNSEYSVTLIDFRMLS